MLTVEELKNMTPGVRFASGFVLDNPDGVNMSNSGKLLRWVAIRGKGYHDWAIYIHFADRSEDAAAQEGDKVCLERHIKQLIPCEDEAFGLYRF